MGMLLESEQLVPDLIVSSTARRSKETARLVGEACGYSGELRLIPDLYHASVDQWEAAVRELPDEKSRILMVGHNPGIEFFQRLLSGKLEPFPTATLAVLRLETDHWREFQACPVTVEAVHRPKEL
jgi:phosphohistidine phosphatase